MEQFSSKIFHLSIQTSQDTSLVSRSFSAKPSREKEEAAGKLFGFVCVSSTDEKKAEFLHFIINRLKENYYTLEESADTNIRVPNIEDALENALRKTNIDIFAYLEKERMLIDPKNIGVLAAVNREREIVFSSAGSISVYLFHFVKNSSWKIVNVYDSVFSSKEEFNPLKFFTQTTYGQLRGHDIMFFCTTNILDYLSLEKIKNIVTQNEPSDAGRIFKTILGAINTPKLFVFSLITPQKSQGVAYAREKDLKNFNYAAAASNDSLRKLSNTELNTQKLLNPSLETNLKKLFSLFPAFMTGLLKNIKNSAISKPQEPKPSIFPKKIRRKKLIDIQKILQKFIDVIRESRFIRFILQTLINISQRFYEWFRTLPVKSKIMAVLFIAVLVLLVQSIAKITLANISKRELRVFNEMLAESKKLGSAAEASIIYQDEAMARSLYLQAIEALKGIPKKYSALPEVATLSKNYGEKLEDLRHVTEIRDPIIIGNWGNLDTGTNIAPLLFNFEGTLYSQNYSNLSLYSINTQTRVLGTVSPPVKNLEQIISGVPFRNEILLLNKNNTLFSFQPRQNSLKPIPINISLESDIAAMETFSSNLYLLDIQKNQIIRYLRTPQGFIDPENWIRDDIVSVTESVDLAIDGYIYVLQKNGEILRLYNGKLSNFTLKFIDPPLISPAKISASASMKYIYILDPTMKRVLVVSKEGDLVEQYTSRYFDNLKDFVVLEQEKKIYVLNSSTVYGFAVK